MLFSGHERYALESSSLWRDFFKGLPPDFAGIVPHFAPSVKRGAVGWIFHHQDTKAPSGKLKQEY